MQIIWRGYMTEQKRKLSKLCLTGFILSVLSPILLVLNTVLSSVIESYYDWSMYIYFSWLVIIVAAALPVVGLVLSIVGLITAAKKGKKGKGFGIAGIVLPNLYAAFIVAWVVIFGALMISGMASSKKAEEQSDLTYLGSIGYEENTEYDISQYRFRVEDEVVPQGLTVSDKEQVIYARSKLEKTTNSSDKIISGTYQNYNFMIIKRDCFAEWLKEEPLGNMSFTTDEYAVITYSITWEFSGGRICRLNVLKDPSGKFVIVTDCNDYKVITEFFEAE